MDVIAGTGQTSSGTCIKPSGAPGGCDSETYMGIDGGRYSPDTASVDIPPSRASMYFVNQAWVQPRVPCDRPAGCTGSASSLAVIETGVAGIKAGDLVLAANYSARCHTFGGTDILRVVGVPGETVSMSSGFVYLNGTKLNDSYVSHRGRFNAPIEPLSAGQYYLLGDNRTASAACGSLSTGPLAAQDILGKVVQTFPGQ